MTAKCSALVLSAGIALSAATTDASIIIDSAIESANGWTTSSQWSPGLTLLSPNESTEIITLPDSVSTTITSPLFAATIAAGTYTAQFAVGNDGAGLPLLFGFGWTGPAATNTITPVPTAGTWAFWTATYVVPQGDPRIGNQIQFSGDIISFGGDGAFDGVGGLSGSGSGFVVDFVAAVPEPSEAAILMFGLTGFVFGSRRRRRRRSKPTPNNDSLFCKVVFGL